MPSMDLANFSLNKDLIGIDVGRIYLDLHNNFDFGGYSKSGTTVEIKLIVTTGDWVPADTPAELLLRFEDVSYFETRGNLDDGTSIDEMGFFENSTQGKVDYNGANKPLQGANLLVFRFIGGGEIAVSGEKATCIVTKKA
jgi:hypothetical protein